jgi:hypothetical protein
VAVVSTETYSNTTTKHQNEIRSALRGRDYIEVPCVEHGIDENIKDMYEAALALAQKQKRARVRDYMPEIHDLIENSAKFARLHGHKKCWAYKFEKMESEEVLASLLNLSQKEIEAEKKAKAKRERAQKKAEKEALMKLTKGGGLERAKEIAFKLINHWRETGQKYEGATKEEREEYRGLENLAHSAKVFFNFANVDYLRLSNDGEHVETYRSASIPVTVAKGLWRRLQRGEDVKGMSLGHYTVTKLENDILTVGCHSIPMSEIEYIAECLGLKEKSA